MEDGEKPRAPRERLRSIRVGREGLLMMSKPDVPQMTAWRMGGRAALGIHPRPEQQSEPQEDLPPSVPETELPKGEDQ